MTHQKTYTDRQYLVYRIGRDIDESHFSDAVKSIKKVYKVFDNIDQCIIEILSLNTYGDLPRSINIDYSYFQGQEIPLKEIVLTLKTIVALTANRLGRGYEPTKIHFRIGRPITKTFSDYLESIGVDNLTPTPTYWGKDVWLKTVDQINLGKRCWPKFLIEGNESLQVCEIEKQRIEFKLTPRQKEITYLIVSRGLSNKQIARSLGISESAVKLHIGMVLKKYGLRNRTQLSRALTEVIPA